ncbi:MAG: hypothetical protein ACNA7W_17470 [Pseudomonadales bacterium]
MKARTYLLLCVAVAIAVAATVLFVPAVADAIEVELLTFLSTNAR